MGPDFRQCRNYFPLECQLGSAGHPVRPRSHKIKPPCSDQFRPQCFDHFGNTHKTLEWLQQKKLTETVLDIILCMIIIKCLILSENESCIKKNIHIMQRKYESNGLRITFYVLRSHSTVGIQSIFSFISINHLSFSRSLIEELYFQIWMSHGLEC